MWRIVKDAGFMYFHTQNMNQDPHENTFEAVCFYFGSNRILTVGQFVDALKISTISGLVFEVCRKLTVRIMVLLF
jgi:hypothetical protein